MNSTTHDEENCGFHFNLEQFLNSRKKTKLIISEVAKKIQPGMSENQAALILNQKLDEHGFEKFWHPTKIRFNKNTIRSFRELSEEVILEKDDIYFIDVGPVFDNHEADYGETFVLGTDPKLVKLQNATKQIFDATQERWKQQKLSGNELYKFAEDEATKLGFKLNTNMYGHRLGDFPHALHYKGKLGELNFSPKSHLWVLEIHLIDENINRGAFFEDILI